MTIISYYYYLLPLLPSSGLDSIFHKNCNATAMINLINFKNCRHLIALLMQQSQQTNEKKMHLLPSTYRPQLKFYFSLLFLLLSIFYTQT